MKVGDVGMNSRVYLNYFNTIKKGSKKTVKSCKGSVTTLLLHFFWAGIVHHDLTPRPSSKTPPALVLGVLHFTTKLYAVAESKRRSSSTPRPNISRLMM